VILIESGKVRKKDEREFFDILIYSREATRKFFLLVIVFTSVAPVDSLRAKSPLQFLSGHASTTWLTLHNVLDVVQLVCALYTGLMESSALRFQ
jgi:hypothetical protein